MRFNSNDSRTPSERIDGELLRRLIEQNNAMPGTTRGPRRNGRGVSEDGPSMPWPPAGGRGGVVDGTMRRGESGMLTRNESGNGGNGSGGNGSGGCGCGNGNCGNGSCGNCGCGGTGNGGCGCGGNGTDGNGMRGNGTTGRNGMSGNGDGDDTVSWGLYGYPLAMVYAPVQCFGELYEPDEGLSQGTIFRQLDLPFTGKGGCRQ